MKIEDKSLIIIAPHPDDELIGCYSLLKDNKVKKVIYLMRTDDRVLEVKAFAEHMGFEYEFMTWTEIWGEVNNPVNKDEIYVVPSANDNHIKHRKVNGITLGLKNRGVYSIDMNTEYRKCLSKVDRAHKKELLNKFYPSQAHLWNYDPKYFQFEGIVFEY